MNTVFIANAAATFFMLGLTWFVQVVHYSLFPAVGQSDFTEYHRLHSRRTTWVVLPPMAIELGSSFILLFDPPAGETGLVLAGAIFAAATWVLTAAGAAPAHGRIGREGLNPVLMRRLTRFSWIRTLAWTAHGVVVVTLLAATLPGTI